MSEQASHQLINADSGNTEIYTPPEIVTRWQEVLGVIDLDPASSEVANRSIRAKQIYTEPTFEVVGELSEPGVDWHDAEDKMPLRRYRDWGGLAREWHGRCCINPPFGSPEAACKPGCTKKGCVKRGWHTATDLPGMNHWVNHFVGEYEAGRMTEGVFLCFAATSEGWFRPLLKHPQCYFHGRTNYMLPDGTRYQGATKGSVCTYVGPNVARFAAVFGDLGTIKVEYRVKG